MIPEPPARWCSARPERTGLRALVFVLVGWVGAAPPGLALGQSTPGTRDASFARAEVVSEPVEVGAIFELEIVVAHPPGAEAAPVIEERLGDFRILGAVPVETEYPRPGESRFRLRLGAFVLPGDHEIPAVPVGIRAPDGELSLIETPAAPVRVVSSLAPEAEAAEADIHDIRGPFELTVPPRWGRIGLLALGLLLLAAVAIWLWRRRSLREEAVVPLPPPVAEAEAALARLGRSGLLERGEVIRYYERLAGIMKRYAGRRFATPWSERTTGEILRDLGIRAPAGDQEALPLLASILGEADLAKFSERPFRPDAARSCFGEAGTFLDRTRPPVTPEGDSGGTAPGENRAALTPGNAAEPSAARENR